MSGNTNLDWDSIDATVSDLEMYHASDGELTGLSELGDFLSDASKNHCNFLGDAPKTLDPSVSDGVAGFLKSTNDSYNSLILKLNDVLSYRSIDSDGAVSTGSGGSANYGGSAGGSGSSSYASSSPASYVSGVASPSESTISELSSAAEKSSISVNSGDVLSRKIDGHSSTSSGSQVAASVGSLKSSSGSSSFSSTGGVVSTVGSALGTTALGSIISEVGGLGSTISKSALTSISYPMGNYSASANFVHAFNEGEKQSISDILERYGYSKEEIEKVFSGDYDASNILVENVSNSLEIIIKTNPGLKNEIINQYGFDIFNDDGSINNDKLSMALYIDDLSGKDNYSLLSLLSNQYGVNLVNHNSLNNYSNQFESLLLKDYSIKDKIINRYGFDIYNSDGTVNSDRLTLAMLVDSKSSNDVTLSSIASETISSDINGYLNTSLKSVKSSSGVKDISGLIPVAAAVSAVGAATGIGVATHMAKKNSSEKSDSERVDSIISLSTMHDEEKNDDKKWMNDIINNE